MLKQILLVMCISFLFNTIQAQNHTKWYKITENDLIVMSLQSISGVADGVNQAIVHHKYGKGKQFWDNKVSWTNKYDMPSRDPKFFGSTTFLVWVTDGFHLTRMIDRTTSIVSIGISFAELREYDKKDIWKVIMKKVLLSYLVNRTAFVITYNNL
jgi:hypothetical protein